MKLVRTLAIIALLCGHAALASVAEAGPRYFVKTPQTTYSNWFQVASHNTNYQKFRGDSSAWAGVLDYTKVMELDVWPFNGWRVYHNAPHETYCSGNLSQCLKEIRDWHDRHAGHEPVTIFLEMKATEGFQVDSLNGLLCGPTRGSKLGGRGSDDAVFACSELFRPGDLLKGGQGSLREAARAGAWPSLDAMKGKIIFVVNSADASNIGKYLTESKTTVTPSNGRDQASAFVAVPAESANDITGVPTQLTDYNHDLAKQVIFYNAECKQWTAALGQLIREANYLSRGYYCGDNNDPRSFENTWIDVDAINFVAYDNIEYAYGLTAPPQSWYNGYPQGDFGNWHVIPDKAQFAKASWSNKLRRDGNMTPELAQSVANSDPRIAYYFLTRRALELTGQGVFAANTAVFFSGSPVLGDAVGYADTYERPVRWKVTPNKAQSAKASWSNKVREAKVSLQDAFRVTEGDPQIRFFFYVTKSLSLTGHGTFAPGTAVFFSGEPTPGDAIDFADLYIKE
ncbi:MAG TPA: Ca2+-dependent phosphoinositide-specific phospholipase C [Kofleriaceae bacterium]|nr:Ca2+-dependent phosphoinositide-specific phospholipase C [Kofleriaceae bacterium]